MHRGQAGVVPGFKGQTLVAQGAALRPAGGARRIEQIDRIAGRAFHQQLMPAGGGEGIAGGHIDHVLARQGEFLGEAVVAVHADSVRPLDTVPSTKGCGRYVQLGPVSNSGNS